MIPSLHMPDFYYRPELGAYKEILGLFTLSPEAVEKRFADVEESGRIRQEEFLSDLSFPVYTPGRDLESIQAEFEEFDWLRLHLHSPDPSRPRQVRPEFQIAQQLLALHRYRQPNCVTFEHSKADDSYNCSCLTLNGRKYFALEGPTEQTLEYFYRLLQNWDVGTLVALTDDQEKGVPKCFPYWQNRTFEIGGEIFFALPLEDQYDVPMNRWEEKPIPFLHMPQWKDHQGAEDLPSFMEQVDRLRKRADKDHILAVHCSAGVGRTGTFLAITALLDAIDEQIAAGISPENISLSIPELFLRINLYRRPLVAKEAQYVTLYRAVDYYLDQLKKESLKPCERSL